MANKTESIYMMSAHANIDDEAALSKLFEPVPLGDKYRELIKQANGESFAGRRWGR